MRLTVLIPFFIPNVCLIIGLIRYITTFQSVPTSCLLPVSMEEVGIVPTEPTDSVVACEAAADPATIPAVYWQGSMAAPMARGKPALEPSGRKAPI